MIVLLGTLTLINLPIAFWLCQRLQLNSFWHILVLGLVQYCLSGILIGVFITISDAWPRLWSWQVVESLLALGVMAPLVLAPFTLPIVLLAALGIWWFRRWKPDPTEMDTP